MNEAVQSAENQAHQWLHKARVGTLCTLSTHGEVAGHPFGSLVPYILDASDRPLIRIAKIAAHTKNLAADPRASLFISDPEAQGDPQSAWRLTLMGVWSRVLPQRDAEVEKRAAPYGQEAVAQMTDDDYDKLLAAYQERIGVADEHLALPGFDLWRLEACKALRFIAGFGKVAWLRPEDVLGAQG
jgi:hypothetical protein